MINLTSNLFNKKMKSIALFLLTFFIPGLLFAQNQGPATAYKKVSLKPGDPKPAEIITALIPANWSTRGSIIFDEAGLKVGELAPGVNPDCEYQSGAGFVKELKAGYPDDPHNVKFISSKTLTLKGRTWTEGIRGYMSDGKRIKQSVYQNLFFTTIKKRCFVIAFYGLQPTLKNEKVIHNILSSIDIKGSVRN